VTNLPDPVLIVGSLAFDDLDMPTGEYRDVLGGSAIYSALTASLVVPGAIRVVGVIGTDFPDASLADLRARGVDTEGIERASGRTFRWYGRYSDDLASRTTLDTQLNVFADFSPKIPLAYRRSPYVLLGNIHPKLQIGVLEQVERPKLIVADTMNFWIEREQASLSEMLRRIDLLVINEEEARQLSGIHNLVKAAADIRKRGPRMLVIKRGEFGALLFDGEGIFFVPAYPLEEILDPTGAGDAFSGGLVGYLASMHDGAAPSTMRRAMIYASVLGSFCVEGIGPARLLAIGRSELDARLASFVRLIDFGGGLSPLP
jgi:sugar/nucleoside kinase (ribokinase family)